MGEVGSTFGGGGEGILSPCLSSTCGGGCRPGFRSPQDWARLDGWLVGAAGGVLRGQGPRMQPRPEARAPFEFFAYQAYLPQGVVF